MLWYGNDVKKHVFMNMEQHLHADTKEAKMVSQA
jgi:hypothetical protein